MVYSLIFESDDCAPSNHAVKCFFQQLRDKGHIQIYKMKSPVKRLEGDRQFVFVISE